MRRKLRIAGGFALLIGGGILSLPGVPGPGIALCLLGLLILRDHFAWPNQLLGWLKRRAARLRAKAAGGRSGPPVALTRE